MKIQKKTWIIPNDGVLPVVSGLIRVNCLQEDGEARQPESSEKKVKNDIENNNLGCVNKWEY